MLTARPPHCSVSRLQPYLMLPESTGWPKKLHISMLDVKLIELVKLQPNFIIFADLHLHRFPTKQCIYCPQHLLCVPTLPCRNNIVRFLCCLKMKFAHELCWQTTKQCQSYKIVLISLQAMFNMSSTQPKDYKIWWRFHKAISI